MLIRFRMFQGAALIVVLLYQATALAQSRFPGGEQSRTLNTTGHPKSKGVDVKLDFPESWTIEEGKRPNTVAIAVSDRGRGLENCVVVINHVEQLGWPRGQAATETSQTFASPARLRKAAEDSGSEYLSGGAAALEGLPSRWFESVSLTARDGGQMSYVSITFQVIYREALVNLTCGTGAVGREAATAAYQRQSILFRLIANSLVIPSRWR